MLEDLPYMFRIGRMFLGLELTPSAFDGELGLELSGDSRPTPTLFASVKSG